MVVAGNETTTKLLANAGYWGWQNPDELAPVVRRPSRIAAVGRGDAALRHVEPDAGPPGDRASVDAARRHDPGRRRAAAAGRLGQPRRARVREPRRLSTSTARSARSSSFGIGAHFCLGASLAALEARVALTELFKRVRGLRNGRGQFGPRPLGQRARVRQSAHHGGGPLMPRFAPLPDRRPAIVTGASSGIGEATAIALAARGFPVVLGARRVEKLDDIVGEDPRRRRRSRRVPPRRHRPRLGRRRSRPTPLTRSARSRSWWPARATSTSAARRDRAPTTSLAAADQPGRRPPARHPVLPGMVERRRGDIVFVSSDVALRPRPYMGAYVAAKAALGRDGHQLADGARGHRRAGVDRPPRPDEHVDGLDLPAELDRTRARGLGQVGPGAPRLLPARRRIWRAPSRFVAETPRGGFIANIELQPEAPLATTKERQRLKVDEEALTCRRAGAKRPGRIK